MGCDLKTTGMLDFSQSLIYAPFRIGVVPRPILRLLSSFSDSTNKNGLRLATSWPESRCVSSRPSRKQLKRRRIFVAEDNTAFLQKMISMLEVEFEIVGTALDGKSALDLICHHEPDLVVLDLAMPVLNGIDVLKQLAKRPLNPPVVVCSVETDPEILEAARQAGAIGYVSKVRLEKDLMLAVKLALQNKSFFSPPTQ